MTNFCPKEQSLVYTIWMNNNCIFCKITKGEVPCAKIYEDETVFAFLAHNPINIGHTLLVPKIHAVNIYEMPDETLAKLAPVLKKLATSIKSATGADGINIEMNNDSAAGQIIFHAHLHIVPRFKDDGFTHWKGARDYREGEMSIVAEKISTAL